MPTKKDLILIIFLLCFPILFACASLQKPPIKKNYFDLDIYTRPNENHDFIKHGQVLLMKDLLIASEFDSHSFVYRIDKNEYTTDFYNEFVAYPTKLITEKIAETLYSTKHFTPFLDQKQQDVSFRLFGKITRLYKDMQNKNSPQAIMEIGFILEKKVDDTFKKIFSHTYQARETLSSPEPDQLVDGWSKGLHTITSDFLNDLIQQGLINTTH